MNGRYIAFDVETPNYNNDRISAIGITVIENGEITDEISLLVNPDTSFDSFNVRLTGITPEMVEWEPSFPEIWRRIEPIMDSGLLIAHNAPFDMSVLAKCLNHYEIEWHPFTYYACTCAMGRACYPGMENHRLNTMCARLGISLSHHNAGSDSRACAELLLNYMKKGISVDRYIRCFDIINNCTDRTNTQFLPGETSNRLPKRNPY